MVQTFLWAWSVLVVLVLIWNRKNLAFYLLENRNILKCQNLDHLHFQYSCRFLQCQRQLLVFFQMLGPHIFCLGFLGSMVIQYLPSLFSWNTCSYVIATYFIFQYFVNTPGILCIVVFFFTSVLYHMLISVLASVILVQMIYAIM